MNSDSREMRTALDDDAIGRLIESAGTPALPDPEHSEAVRRAVHAQWQAVVTQRRHSRVRWMALAASVVVAAVALTVWQLQLRATPAYGGHVGVLAQSAPGIVVRPRAEVRDNASAEMGLFGGDVLETATQGVRLRLDSGIALRLAPHSKVRFEQVAKVDLLQGALYMSENDANAPLLVGTSFGTVQHVGTRYVAQLNPASLTVGVRDGAVYVTAGDRRISVAANEQVSIDSSGHALRETLSSTGDAWSWIDALAKPIAIENLRLDDFLAWIAHETGRKLSFSDDATRHAAHETLLHGSVDRLTPEQALQTVMATTDFEHQSRGDVLVVKRIQH
jgi:ferric-dicitrate binding protein FerR (iron transport regulator)